LKWQKQYPSEQPQNVSSDDDDNLVIAETSTAQQLRNGEAEAHISQLRKSACNVTTQRSNLNETLMEI